MEVASKLVSIANLGVERAVSLACEILLRGGVIALPTDTIYGVAALAKQQASVERLYSIKRRDLQKPLAICVGRIDEIYEYCNVPGNVERRLMESLLPGKVTLCFERSAKLPAFFNPQTSTVGVRIPNSLFVRGLCATLGEPLALTSANISNERSTIEVREFESLWPKLDAVFDGVCESDEDDRKQSENSEEWKRAGSTVVDLSHAARGAYRLIRPGCAFKHTCCVLEEQFGLHRIQDSQ